AGQWTARPPISREPKAKYIPRIDFTPEAIAEVNRRFGKRVDGVIRTQVCVVGGGMAGASAAVGAGRTGVDTVLVEALGFLGGMGTAAMVYPWMPSMAGGEQIIQGAFMDYYTRLTATGDASRAPGNESVINFDKEALKMALQEEVIASGSKLLLHTWVGGALMEGETIRGVLGHNKSGTIAVLADQVVDCTGDGDIAKSAGAPFEQGRGFDIYGQAVTLFFRMGNVDYNVAFKEQNKRLKRYDQQIPAEYLFADLFKQGKASGELDPNLPISTIYFEKTLNPGVVSINATRVFEVDTTSVLDLTFAEVESRRQVAQLARFLRKRIPGFQKAFLQETATQIGVRESRRVVGEYMLTGEDVIHATKFPDVIARGSFGIDIHCADYTGCGISGLDLVDGSSYDIPYRSLIPKVVDNLLVGGRCISVTHIALGSTRIQPVASATGQAAGVAAALCAR
ncbi:MAG TPA: FAD-dependent oxidoreductase, partial [bacterium]|nr:FAD-dependent oxidoreductase [bacterium]